MNEFGRPTVPSLVRTVGALRRRVLRLLNLENDQVRDSEISKEILPALKGVGEVALIGGAIRDVARAGTLKFKSDLDFVVYGSAPRALHALMESRKAKPNRFGGFAMQFDHWRVDVWHIEDTWAKTSGHRKVERIEDLLDCTFFDWDSVLFDVRSKHLTMKSDYIHRLQSNVMDLCLSENPNPMGSLVRALRRATQWNVDFGPGLTEFALRELSSKPWNAFVELDNGAFSYPLLHTINYRDMLNRLSSGRRLNGHIITTPVSRVGTQLELPFETETTEIAEFRLPA